jgi:hypothetical protein
VTLQLSHQLEPYSHTCGPEHGELAAGGWAGQGGRGPSEPASWHEKPHPRLVSAPASAIEEPSMTPEPSKAAVPSVDASDVAPALVTPPQPHAKEATTSHGTKAAVSTDP